MCIIQAYLINMRGSQLDNINMTINFIVSNSNESIGFPICMKIRSTVHHNLLMCNKVFPEIYSQNFIQNTFTKKC